MAALIRAGVESGEFRSDVDVGAVADFAMALLDGAGVRALIADPAMDVEAARALVAERLAPELGIEAAALLSLAARLGRVYISQHSGPSIGRPAVARPSQGCKLNARFSFR